jgi:dihydropteroate synthase
MFTLNCNGRLLTVDKPIVMGIINITEDSFYKCSRFNDLDAVLVQAEKMIGEGAVILDIGGQSTRPGSTMLSTNEELQRVIKPIELIKKNFPEAYISIDTFYAEVARQAVDAGASIVNDISAGSIDAEMIKTVSSLRVPYVLMHMKGTPKTMQQHPVYEDITREVLDFFIGKIRELQNAGVNDIIIDPGFGFGKTSAHNFQLMRNLAVLNLLQFPILAGISRKSTIYKTLNISPEEALNGTTVLNTICLLNGATILRVHDVKEAIESTKLYLAYKEA